MTEVRTPRLRIVPGTEEIAEAELDDPARLSSLLRADVPEDWPPETLRDALPFFLHFFRKGAGPECWVLGWYGILEGDGFRPTLVGSVGFKGPPDEHGMVEIGYSVLPGWQGKGIASEMVAGLSDWAFRQPGVKLVEAEVAPENAASKRVLERNGFVRVTEAPAAAGAITERRTDATERYRREP